MITNVSGVIKNFEAVVKMDENDFSSAQINLSAEMASISTNNEHRDVHLRTSDFFDVENHPLLKFRSTGVEKIDSDTFTVHGELMLKGITKPVKLKVEYNGLTKDPRGDERAGFVVTGKINRSDWGVNFNSVLETGGVMLSEEVRINSEIQLVKQTESVAVLS
jgi:polyisoprenoid-binding protein YceI